MFEGLNDLRSGDEEVKPYNVFDNYWEHGFFSDIAKSKPFEYSTLAVISINACWIGYDTDENSAATLAEADIQFQIAENLFCFYFTGEVLIRFIAFKRKFDCLKDHWFKFDFVLVFFMVLETWIIPIMLSGSGGGGLSNLSILRLLRLLRLSRMARLMRSVPELVTLIKGMAAAARSVISTLALLIILLYVFGIIFKQQVGSISEEHQAIMRIDGLCQSIRSPIECGNATLDGRSVCTWEKEFNGPGFRISKQCFSHVLTAEQKATCEWSNTTWTCSPAWDEDIVELTRQYNMIGMSMFTLFVGGTLLDNLTDYTAILRTRAFTLFWVFLVFILLSSFTVLNMLIGVLCEVVSATAQGEEERMTVSHFKEKLTAAFEQIDTDGSSKISRGEFEDMKNMPHVLQIFENLGVEPHHLIALSDSLFDDNDELDVQASLVGSANGLKTSKTPGEEASVESLAAVKRKREGKELDFSQFLETVIHMRPKNTASVLDISDLRKVIRKGNFKIEMALDQIQQMVSVEATPTPAPVVQLSPRIIPPTSFERMLDQHLDALKAEVDHTRKQLDDISGN